MGGRGICERFCIQLAVIGSLPLLPDGRIFGQITQRGPKKLSVAGKLGDQKWQNLTKSGRKDEKLIQLCVISLIL
jgi:hypothetical protein